MSRGKTQEGMGGSSTEGNGFRQVTAVAFTFLPPPREVPEQEHPLSPSIPFCSDLGGTGVSGVMVMPRVVLGGLVMEGWTWREEPQLLPHQPFTLTQPGMCQTWDPLSPLTMDICALGLSVGM